MRAQQQHGGHGDVDHQARALGPHRAHHALHDADQEAADQRAAEAAHAAHHHDHEGHAQRLDAHEGLGTADGRRQHARDGGGGRAEREHQAEDAEHVDAQQRHHLGRFAACAHRAAQSRAFEHPPQAHGQHGGETDHEEPVLGIDEAAPHHHALQQIGHGHAVAQRPPLQDHQLLHREREAHGDEDVEFVRLGVHVAQHQLFGEPAQGAHHQRHHRQREPEAQAPARHLVAEIRAQQVERAVREVHEAQQAEHDGQADRQQEIQHADADPVDDL